MLFALNSVELGARHCVVERHLEECHGCRILVEEMAEFYKNAERTFDSLDAAPGNATEAIMTVSGDMVRHRRSDAAPRPLRNVDHFRGFIRRHRVLASTELIMVLGAVALAVQFAVTTFSPHPHPSHLSYDEKASLLEVFGTDERPLFSLPVDNAMEIVAREKRIHVPMSLIDDVRGTGDNLLVTGVPLVDDPGHRPNVLRIYDGAKNMLLEKELGSPVTFRGERYTAYFGISSMISEPVHEGKGKDLFVGAVDARSPFCLYRLDHAGNILGEFWHFGHLGGCYRASPGRDGQTQLVLCGMNDVADVNNGSFPVILVLDPRKLSGRTESSASKGFGYPPNECELYYVKVERPGIDKRSGVKGFIASMRVEQDSSMTFVYNNGIDPYLPIFYLNFNRNMELRNIWTEDLTRLVVFKNDNAAVEAALAELKSGIRYWDGTRWTVSRTHVRTIPKMDTNSPL
jgi:hypothetical protein